MTGFRQPRRLSALVMVAAFLVSSAMSAGAQVRGIGGQGSGTGGSAGLQTPQGGQATETKPQPRVSEKDYNSAVSRFPEEKFDPWKKAR
jgi:hypothetical protein